VVLLTVISVISLSAMDTKFYVSITSAVLVRETPNIAWRAPGSKTYDTVVRMARFFKTFAPRMPPDSDRIIPNSSRGRLMTVTCLFTRMAPELGHSYIDDIVRGLRVLLDAGGLKG
jgi:nucleoside-diphosphate-sugar epimerase